MVFMAFLGEKLFAFLFLNGGRAPPSTPLLLMKDPPGSSHYHLIAGEKEIVRMNSCRVPAHFTSLGSLRQKAVGSGR
jgi:hypothetical protein